jgi:hypothetical protein
MSDPVIAEIRKTRHEISARCDHDAEKFYEHLGEVEAELKKSGRFRLVNQLAIVAAPSVEALK